MCLIWKITIWSHALMWFSVEIDAMGKKIRKSISTSQSKAIYDSSIAPIEQMRRICVICGCSMAFDWWECNIPLC